jgi:hypothetical protein
MADPNDVVSLAEAKRMLSIGAVDTTDDANLERVITAVSRRLDRLVGPIVRRAVTNERHNGGSCAVELRQSPAFAITSVAEDGVALVEGTDWIGDRYEPDPSLYDGFVIRQAGDYDTFFAPGRQNVVASYTAGRYENTAAVGAIYKEAAALMIRNLWRSYTESIGQVNEFDVPVQSFPTFAVPTAVRELLHSELQPEIGF